MAMRCAPCVLAICILASGCCAAPRRADLRPEALVIAFADGFHSGVIMERGLVPARLVHDRAGPEVHPWVVLHFGERRWIRGEADSAWDAVRLGTVGGDGGVQIDAVEWWRHDRGGTDPAAERVWVFLVTGAEAAGLVSRLEGWVAPGGRGEALASDCCWWPSSHAWTLGRNCHDFTADLLAGAGIGAGWAPVRVASELRQSLDRAWVERGGR